MDKTWESRALDVVQGPNFTTGDSNSLTRFYVTYSPLTFTSCAKFCQNKVCAKWKKNTENLKINQYEIMSLLWLQLTDKFIILCCHCMAILRSKEEHRGFWTIFQESSHAFLFSTVLTADLECDIVRYLPVLWVSIGYKTYAFLNGWFRRGCIEVYIFSLCITGTWFFTPWFTYTFHLVQCCHQ